jgi:hypothetical protein
MQHLKWEKATIVGTSMVSPEIVSRNDSKSGTKLMMFLRHALRIVPQGGGVAAAFTAHFPELVDGKVALIACAGLVEVQLSSYAILQGHA